MTCSELREYLFAFLDSELDAPLSIELQRHLDRCHACAREVEIERTIRRELAPVLQRDVVEPALDEAVLTRRLERGGVKARSHSIAGVRFKRAATAACLAILAVWLVWWGPNRYHADRLSDLVVTDFQHFLREKTPVQIASADREKVAGWLRERTNVNVLLPPLGPSGGRLLGGRKCEVAGRSAAFAIYEMHGTPASLVVLKDYPGALKGMNPFERKSRRRWVDHCREHTVLAARRGSLIYVAVSQLPETELFCLLTDGEHESD